MSKVTDSDAGTTARLDRHSAMIRNLTIATNVIGVAVVLLCGAVVVGVLR